MAAISVTIKWGKEKLTATVKPDDTPTTLFAQLEQRTGVPVARQKLMAKGAWRGVLKAEMSLAALKDGQNVTLMGTAETLVKPAVETKFLEDLAEDEAAASGLVLPAGIANLGNTCYMNSTLQCLRAVPELRAGLDRTTAGGGAAAGGPNEVPSALAATYATLDASTSPVEPMRLVATLRTAFPQFAQRGRGGGYSQQDAEELYSTLMSALAGAMADEGAGGRGAGNVVDGLFGIDFEERLACAETDAEPEIVKSDSARKLVCNIQGGMAGANVDHLHEGLKLALVGSLDKRSEVLGRDATWTKTQAIKRLPPYLCVQFMRFYWKATPDSADHTGVKCKIMRPITFTPTMDVFPFLTGPLKAAVLANKKAHGAKVEAELFNKEAKAKAAKAAEAAAAEPAAAPMETDDGPEAAAGDDDDALAAAIAMSIEKPASPEATEGAAILKTSGMPDDFQGNYELFAIVTHKGRSADGGHYMGWVKQDGTKDKWLVFDDDLVSESTTEFVMGLKGGGDEHMSYLQFYRARTGAI